MRRAPSVRRPLAVGLLALAAVLTGPAALAGPVVTAPGWAAASSPRPVVHAVRGHDGTAPVAHLAPVAYRPAGTLATGPVERVCAPAAPGRATCLAERVVTAAPGGPLRVVDRPPAGLGRPAPMAAPVPGRTPSDLQSAYGLTGLPSGGRTVAVVDAFGYPNAERDLAAYRAHFGLPPCTRATGC